MNRVTHFKCRRQNPKSRIFHHTVDLTLVPRLLFNIQSQEVEGEHYLPVKLYPYQSYNSFPWMMKASQHFQDTWNDTTHEPR